MKELIAEAFSLGVDGDQIQGCVARQDIEGLEGVVAVRRRARREAEEEERRKREKEAEAAPMPLSEAEALLLEVKEVSREAVEALRESTAQLRAAITSQT